MIAMCSQIQMPHRHSQSTLTFILQPVKILYLPDAHICFVKIRGQLRIVKVIGGWQCTFACKIFSFGFIA